MPSELVGNHPADLSAAYHFVDLVKGCPLDSICLSRQQDNLFQWHTSLEAIVIIVSIAITYRIQQFKFLCVCPNAGLFIQFPDNTLQAGLTRLHSASGILPCACPGFFRCPPGQQNITVPVIDPNASHQPVLALFPWRTPLVDPSGQIPVLIVNIIEFHRKALFQITAHQYNTAVRKRQIPICLVLVFFLWYNEEQIFMEVYSMEFHVNHPLLFIMAGLLIAVVLAQSVFFLVKAVRRSKAIGMDQAKLRKTIMSAAIFTIAPAVAIVISVMTLSKKLGLPLPWLRLSVVGSMSYETVAATNALFPMGQNLGSDIPLTAQQYVTVLLVMTISIMLGIWLVPVIGKKLQKGMANLGKRDAKWADTFQSALFIGMIAAFLGFVFCDVSRLWDPDARFITQTVLENGVEVKQQVPVSATSGLIPVCVMGASALVMVICGLLMRRPKLKWLSEYALPISLVLGMAAAIPITAWLS